MTPDYYATLGLSPTSEDVVIRAAYLALIRRYHPDGNASAAASARTRAINAAYDVLSDPDKRAEYDQLRAAEAWPNLPVWRRRRAVPSRLFAAASMLLLIVLLVVIWSPLPLLKQPDRMPREQLRAPEQIVQPFATLEQYPSPTVEPSATYEEPQQPPLQLDEPLPAPPRLLAAPKARVAPQPKSVQPKITQSAASQLANLDRQQALLFNQSWVRADAAKRTQLLSSRDRFLARRDGCRSDACATAAYLARMREVSEIMVGIPQPPR